MYPQTAADAGIRALLRPGSIAVLGASARRTASGNEAIANLRRHGFDGSVHVVHPTAAEVDGYATVSSVADLPVGIDVALVSIPASAVIASLEQLSERGCRAAIVPAVGMTAAELDGLRRFVAEGTMVVHGPNCMGVLNVTDDVPLWFDDGILTEERPGNVALVTQSGSAAIFVVRSTEHARFSRIVSTGSEIGLSVENYLAWLAGDDATSVIALVLESIKDVAAFTAATWAARSAGKQIVALKVGRTATGAAATTAHTGALVGNEHAYAALFERLDIPLVSDYDELASAIEVMASPTARPAGRRIGAVTISGGQAALVADLADQKAVMIGSLGDDTRSQLAALLPGAEPGNPFDAGASLVATSQGYRDALVAIADDDAIDTVVVLLDAQATLNDVELHYEQEYFTAVREAARQAAKPIVVASSSSVSTHPRCREWLGPDVPLVRGIANALVAVRASAGNGARMARPAERPADLPTTELLAKLRSRVLTAGALVSHELGAELLTAYGLPLVASRSVSTPDEALSWAVGRYPVVAKIVSPQISHRSDVGGVIVDIVDDRQLADALKQIEHAVTSVRPDATIVNYEIQEQVVGGHEAMIGFVSDAIFGATLALGSGGTLVEILGDTAVGSTPLSHDDATSLIRRTRMGTVFGGYRQLMQATETSALADAAVRISWLAHDFSDVLDEADFNPVFVQPGSGRIHIVDWLFVPAATHKGGRHD